MKVRKIARGTFWIGALVTVALGLPLTAIALRALARRAGIGDPEAGLEHILALAAVFAGFPSWLAGGGVARLVAHRMTEREVSVRRSLIPGCAAMTAVGMGMAVLTAVPLGGMPERPLRWLPVFLVGAVVGAVVGVAVGILVAMRQRRHIEKEQEKERQPHGGASESGPAPATKTAIVP
jgi:hypothetical protein